MPRRSRNCQSFVRTVLNLESLEERCLLASAVLASGVLTIHGTNLNDSIIVRQINGRISIDSTRIAVGASLFNSVPATWITTRIQIYGYDGYDLIRCDSENFAGQQGITKPILAYGGNHNDTIWGSYGNDTIWGNAGNDRLYGRFGNDYISGQEGNDVVDGWYGNDSLYGYTGNDTLYGGPGNDYMSGWDGYDVLYGSTGNDTLYGGNHNDLMYGGADNDKLYGNAGVDTLRGEAGNDYLRGGDGSDYIYGGTGIDTFRRSLYSPGFGLSQPTKEDDENEIADVPQQVSGAFLTDPTKDSMYHIIQQQSPVCAFMAALAATADWTGRFPDLGAVNNDLLSFIKYDAATDQYGVTLFVSGSWRKYWVNGDWTESYMPGGPLWPTLYLKAYLKAMNVTTFYSDGSPIDPKYWYSTTGASWQNAGSALKTLVGDTYYGWTTTLDAQTMHDRLRDGYVLVASSKDSGTSWPVVADHAYAVYDVYQENGSWVVKLYNPWGVDTSSGAQYGSNDGLIKISWSTFVNNFEGYYRA